MCLSINFEGFFRCYPLDYEILLEYCNVLKLDSCVEPSQKDMSTEYNGS